MNFVSVITSEVDGRGETFPGGWITKILILLGLLMLALWYAFSKHTRTISIKREIEFNKSSRERSDVDKSNAKSNEKPKYWRFIRLPRDIREDSFRNELKSYFDGLDHNGSPLRRRFALNFISQPHCNPSAIVTSYEHPQVRYGEADENFRGITPLFASKDADVDIIVVPGLGAHPLGSFRSKHGWENWLCDFLPKDMPNCRILVYGYNSSVRESLNKSSISELAVPLLECLKDYRSESETHSRPIIFVGHSLGGLIIKEALAKASVVQDDARDNTQDYNMFRSTYAIILFGVPNFGLRYEQLLALVDGQDNRRLIESLVPDQDSEASTYLNELNNKFIGACKKQSPLFSLVSFYERKPSPTAERDPNGDWHMTGPRSLLVTEQSACIAGSGCHEKRVPLDTNHRDLVRFDRDSDPAYRMVVHNLKTLAQNAPDVVGRRFTQGVHLVADPPSHETLLKFISNSQHLQEIELFRSTRLEGTCEWVSDEVSFQHWISEKTKFLLLIGAAGSGKSHVIAKVIDILSERFRNPLRKDVSTPLMAYFFCRTANLKNPLLSALKSMIGQLARSDDKYAYEISQMWSREFSNGNVSWSSISGLWDKISRSKSLSKRSCIMLLMDGLDECEPAERREFLECAYKDCAMAAGSVVKVFCSGRPELKADLTQVFDNQISSPDVKTIEINWQTKADIELLIKRKMTRMKLNRDKKLRKRVQEAISSDANGMFLWTDLTLNEFVNLKTVEAVETSLVKMKEAQTLDEIYEKTISSLIKDGNELRNKILKETLLCLVYAIDVVRLSLLEKIVERRIGCRVLAFVEDIEAFGSILQTDGFRGLSFSDYAPWRTVGLHSDDLSNTHSSFYDTEDEDIDLGDGSQESGHEVVRIRHGTFVRWYYAQLDRYPNLVIHPDRANAELATICLEQIITAARDNTSDQQLFSYAQTNWHGHLRRMESWTNIPESYVSNITSMLYTIFTDWHVTFSWLKLLSYERWLRVKESLENCIPGLIEVFLNQRGTTDILRGWAYGLWINRAEIMDFIFKTLLQTVENSGLLGRLPEIGEDTVHQRNITRALLFWSSAICPMPVSPSESQFWEQEMWTRYPKTKSYFRAGILNTDDLAIEEYHLAWQDNKNNPTISYELSQLYLRRGRKEKAIDWAQICAELCRKRDNQNSLALAIVLEAKIYQSCGKHDLAYDKYRESMQLGNIQALDELATYDATREGDGPASWFRLYHHFRESNNDDGEDNFAKAILRQPVFSEWHNTFNAASKAIHQRQVRIDAYKKAIHLAKNEEESIMVQCGCRYRLAKAYAEEEKRNPRSLRLWTWILNNLPRSTMHDPTGNARSAALFLLAMEELCRSQELTLHHPLVQFAESFAMDLFWFTRVLILLGKGIEQQPHLRQDAKKLYERALRRLVQQARQTQLNVVSAGALGVTLIALEDFENGSKAFNWTCIYQRAWDNTVSAAYHTGFEMDARNENLQNRISWTSRCDGCNVQSNAPDRRRISGYRYKCHMCAEIDLCETCYKIWQVPGHPRDFEFMRYCRRNHPFLKLPTDYGPETRKEAELLQQGRQPQSIRNWLDMLATKYDIT